VNYCAFSPRRSGRLAIQHRPNDVFGESDIPGRTATISIPTADQQLATRHPSHGIARARRNVQSAPRNRPIQPEWKWKNHTKGDLLSSWHQGLTLL
jgi:hypothetical protein